MGAKGVRYNPIKDIANILGYQSLQVETLLGTTDFLPLCIGRGGHRGGKRNRFRGRKARKNYTWLLNWRDMRHCNANRGPRQRTPRPGRGQRTLGRKWRGEGSRGGGREKGPF